MLAGGTLPLGSIVPRLRCLEKLTKGTARRYHVNRVETRWERPYSEVRSRPGGIIKEVWKPRIAGPQDGAWPISPLTLLSWIWPPNGLNVTEWPCRSGSRSRNPLAEEQVCSGRCSFETQYGRPYVPTEGDPNPRRNPKMSHQLSRALGELSDLCTW